MLFGGMADLLQDGPLEIIVGQEVRYRQLLGYHLCFSSQQRDQAIGYTPSRTPPLFSKRGPQMPPGRPVDLSSSAGRGQWMGLPSRPSKLSLWDCIASCNTLANLEIKQGSYLWTSAKHSIHTIIPKLLSEKLTQLSVPSICQWITSSLTDRQQLVRLGKLTSRTHTISTGTPQCCVLSPLLFSLYTNDCTSNDPSVKLLKFADDTTVIGLIKDGD